jgi:hypothetical protein
MDNNIQEQKINVLINNVRAKSQVRTKIPDALNRFPINKSKLLQKIILKAYEFLFREQRTVNNEMLDVFSALSIIHLQTIEKINENQNILQTKINEISKIADELTDVQMQTIEKINENQNILQTKFNEINGSIYSENFNILRQLNEHKLKIIDIQKKLMLILEKSGKQPTEPLFYNQTDNQTGGDNILKEQDHTFDVTHEISEDKLSGTSCVQKIYLELTNKINFTKENEISSIPYIINFQDKDNNSINFINSGFSYPESWGTWSCAKDAIIFFELEEYIITMQPLYLKINFCTFTKNNHRQLFEFYLNNILLAKGEYENDGNNILVLDIQKAVQKQNRFEIKIPNAISPEALSINKDNRELGIGLINMQLLKDL